MQASTALEAQVWDDVKTREGVVVGERLGYTGVERVFVRLASQPWGNLRGQAGRTTQ